MKTVTIKFGSVDNATSFVKAIEDFESHFDLIYGQYVVDAKSLLGVMTMDIRNKVDLRIMERENDLGICGQPFCCSRFLKDFQPVSIKMAKEQGLSLNPTKISGA